MRGTRVFNLRTGKYESFYTLGPRSAVIAAHAQSLGDWNTWDYEAKYGPLVRVGQACISCGDFTALR